MRIFKSLFYSEDEERLSIKIESIQVKCYSPGIYIIYVINPNIYYWKIIYILTKECKGLYMGGSQTISKMFKVLQVVQQLIS